jgi:hypothetical protein
MSSKYNVPPRQESETIDEYVERIKHLVNIRGNAIDIRPGHLYQLKNFEDSNDFQVLQFIEKEPKHSESTELVTIHDGTTNEAVLEMLIDRCSKLYLKFPSDETAEAIGHLSRALELFELRTLRRIARDVEGKHIS